MQDSKIGQITQYFDSHSSVTFFHQFYSIVAISCSTECLRSSFEHGYRMELHCAAFESSEYKLLTSYGQDEIILITFSVILFFKYMPRHTDIHERLAIISGLHISYVTRGLSHSIQ